LASIKIAISEARISLGLSEEGKAENEVLLAETFGTFLLVLLAHLPPGDVSRQARTPSHQNRLNFRLSFQSPLIIKGHYPNFHNFTVLFQPHIYIYI
jgi:hypothetical protein